MSKHFSKKKVCKQLDDLDCNAVRFKLLDAMRKLEISNFVIVSKNLSLTVIKSRLFILRDQLDYSIHKYLLGATSQLFQKQVCLCIIILGRQSLRLLKRKELRQLKKRLYLLRGRVDFSA